LNIRPEDGEPAAGLDAAALDPRPLKTAAARTP
jgi:hypothetical protein